MDRTIYRDKKYTDCVKKIVTNHNAPLSLQTDNGTELKKKCTFGVLKAKEFKAEFGTSYNPKHQGAVETFNQTVQVYLTIAKDHQREKYSIKECLNDFLIYYDGRAHSKTKSFIRCNYES